MFFMTFYKSVNEVFKLLFQDSFKNSIYNSRVITITIDFNLYKYAMVLLKILTASCIQPKDN